MASIKSDPTVDATTAVYWLRDGSKTPEISKVIVTVDEGFEALRVTTPAGEEIVVYPASADRPSETQVFLPSAKFAKDPGSIDELREEWNVKILLGDVYLPSGASLPMDEMPVRFSESGHSSVADAEILERAADILAGPTWGVPYTQTSVRVRGAAQFLRGKGVPGPVSDRDWGLTDLELLAKEMFPANYDAIDDDHPMSDELVQQVKDELHRRIQQKEVTVTGGVNMSKIGDQFRARTAETKGARQTTVVGPGATSYAVQGGNLSGPRS